MSRQPIPSDYSLDALQRDLRKLEVGALPITYPLKQLEQDRSAQSVRELKRLLGIIDAMTVDERRRPTETIDDSRCRRIGAGAGVAPSEVKEMLRQFQEVQEIVRAARRMGGS